MKSEKLLDAIGEVRDAYIEDANAAGKHRRWLIAASVAAAILAAALFVGLHGFRTEESFHADGSYASMEYRWFRLIQTTEVSPDGSRHIETFGNNRINSERKKQAFNGFFVHLSEHDPSDAERTGIYYNAEGKLEAIHTYDADGTLLGKWAVEYDEDSLKTKLTYDDADGNRLAECYYSYNASQAACFAGYYDEDGNLHDADGNLIVDWEPYWKNELVCEYDTNGNLTKRTTCFPDGFRIVEVYSADFIWPNDTCYDADGDISSETIYESVEDGYVKKSIDYDDDGNLKEEIVCKYNADGLLTKVSYYDADGNLTKTTQYDPDGNPVSETYE